MGRTAISHIARREALKDDNMREKQEAERPESVPQQKERLTDAEWLQVFQYLDANKPYTQKQVVGHFERKGLRFSRKTLARRIGAREKIERRVADATRGKKLEQDRLHSDEETIPSRGQISVRDPGEDTKMTKPIKEAVARLEAPKRASSPEESSNADDHSPGASSAPERRSSRLSKPPEAPPSTRVRRSTRLEKVPRKRFVESDSEPSSASSESSASDEEGGDSDDDFTETEEDHAPILHRARSAPHPKSNIRSSSQSQNSKNVANTSCTQIPFVLVQTTRRIRPRNEPSVPPPELGKRPAPAFTEILKEKQGATSIASPTSKVLSPRMLSFTSMECSHSDEVGDYSTNAKVDDPSFKPAVHVHGRMEASALPDGTEPEDCTLAPRLKRKRKKLHDRQEAARLSDEPSSEAHPGSEKRVRLTPTPVLLEPSPFESTPETGDTPPCASPAFVPSPRWHPDPPSPLLMAIPPFVLGARTKLESELEQRGCRLNLWDAWIP